MNNLSESCPTLREPGDVNKRFSQSARTYDQAASVQAHIARELFNQLPDAHTLERQSVATTVEKPTTNNEQRLNILEIGCGTGLLSKHLIMAYPDVNLTLSDFSSAMLQVARGNIEKWQREKSDQDNRAAKLSPQITPHPMPTLVKLNPETDFKDLIEQSFSTSLNTNSVKYKNTNGDFTNHDTTSYDLIVSSMAIHWFENIEQTLQLIRRQLKPHGHFYFSTITENSFPEWQQTLQHLNLPVGLRTIPPIQNILKTETITKNYGSSLEFLKEMKKTGAHSPRDDYQQLTAIELKKAITHMDQQHSGRISWEIQYGKLPSAV